MSANFNLIKNTHTGYFQVSICDINIAVLFSIDSYISNVHTGWCKSITKLVKYCKQF